MGKTRDRRPPDRRAELRAAARARRREERAEVRRFTRAARRRRNAWLIALAAAGTLFGLLAFAVYSPLLALRQVEVHGTSRIDAGEIVAALDGKLGSPLAFLDEAAVADELAAFPLIRSYVVELSPPDTMRVRITEREPIGAYVRGDEFELVDPAGIVVERSATRPEQLPVLDLPQEDAELREAVAEVLLALPPEVLVTVDRVSASTRDDVAFALRDTDQHVVWGSAEDSARKAEVLAALLERFAGSGPGEYDVSAAGSAVFREL